MGCDGVGGKAAKTAARQAALWADLGCFDVHWTPAG